MAPYRRAFAYFRPDARLLAGALALVALASLLGLLTPVPLAIFFNLLGDGATGEGFVYRLFDWIPRQRALSTILLLAVSMLVLRLLHEALRAAHGYLAALAGYHARARAQVELFEKFLQLSLAAHASRPQGEALYRLSQDVQGVQALLNVLLSWAVHGATLLIMLAILLDLDARLTLVALVAIPALWVAMAASSRRLARLNDQQKRADAGVAADAQRMLGLIVLIQGFGRERDEAGRFSKSVGAFTDASRRLHLAEVLFWLLVGGILAGGTAAIFGVGGAMVLEGALSLGSFWLFVSYLASLFDPLHRLSSSATQLQAAAAGVRRVFEVLDEPPRIAEGPGARPLPPALRRLAFEGVRFRYAPDAPDVLSGVSLVIEPGETVAFVGASGAGKTTLLNLLPRFLDPTGGRVALDGVDLRDARLRDVRGHVAIVPQDNPILAATLAENIAFGRPDASAVELLRAAELAGMEDLLATLPRGLETMIGERGANLSVGQRQRVAIARALVSGAPILALDEPTSGLDAHAEARVLETLSALQGQRTILIVSHRISTARLAPRILVLHGGRVVEEGTHEALVAQHGRYWQMARLQHVESESADPPAHRLAEAATGRGEVA